MNHNTPRTHAARRDTELIGADVSPPSPLQETPVVFREVNRLCSNFLHAESEFYGRLEDLLTALVTANLFSTEAATSLSEQMDDLQRQRDELNHSRHECLRALAASMDRKAGPIRLAELEPFLAERDRVQLRQRRLHVLRRLEGVQKLLWRTDVLLASRHSLFAELISALTGQSTSTNCYSANGRRAHQASISVVESVS